MTVIEWIAKTQRELARLANCLAEDGSFEAAQKVLAAASQLDRDVRLVIPETATWPPSIAIDEAGGDLYWVVEK